MTPLPAASYARLSNTQDSNEPTLEFQHKHNVEFLTRLGYNVAEDALLAEPKGHHSGRFLTQRPTMQQLMELLPKFKAVAFFDFSRFSRSVEFTLQFIRAANKSKTRLYNTSTGKEITIRNATEYIDTTVQSIFAEYESIVGSDRMINAYRRARENGWVYHRKPPFGFIVTGSKMDRRFERNEDFKTVLAFFDLLGEGHSVSECAQILRDRGYTACDRQKHQVPLEPYHLRRVLRTLKLYEPFVDAITYRQAVRYVSTWHTAHCGGHKIIHRVGILYRLLHCELCGRSWRLYANRPHGHGLWYGYTHDNGYLCPNRRLVARTKLDVQVIALMDAVAENIEQHPEILQALTQTPEPKGPSRESEIRELDKRLHNLRELLVRSELKDSDYADFAQMRDETEEQLAKLKQEDRPTELLTKQETEMLATQAHEWHEIAHEKPDIFNHILCDLFNTITVGQDNILRFHPREIFGNLFVGLLNPDGTLSHQP